MLLGVVKTPVDIRKLVKWGKYWNKEGQDYRAERGIEGGCGPKLYLRYGRHIYVLRALSRRGLLWCGRRVLFSIWALALVAARLPRHPKLPTTDGKRSCPHAFSQRRRPVQTVISTTLVNLDIISSDMALKYPTQIRRGLLVWKDIRRFHPVLLLLRY